MTLCVASMQCFPPLNMFEILNYVEVMYLILSLLLHLKAKTPFHDQVFKPQRISSLLEVPGHQASVTQVTRQPGPHLGQVSVPQRGGRPRPHQGVGGQPPSSPHLLSLSPEKQQCWDDQNVNWLSPLAVKLLPLGDGHVDVARGGAVADPHAHCAGQRHTEQTNEENLGSTGF